AALRAELAGPFPPGAALAADRGAAGAAAGRLAGDLHRAGVDRPAAGPVPAERAQAGLDRHSVRRLYIPRARGVGEVADRGVALDAAAAGSAGPIRCVRRLFARSGRGAVARGAGGAPGV